MKSTIKFGLLSLAFLLAGCCENKKSSCSEKKVNVCYKKPAKKVCAKKVKKACPKKVKKACPKKIRKECSRKVKSTCGNSKVYFCFDSACLTDNASKELDKVIKWMKKNKSSSILMEAHSSKEGNSQYNMNLSKRRLMSAYNYLLNHGIDKSRVEAKYFGESKVPASNHEDNRVIMITHYSYK